MTQHSQATRSTKRRSISKRRRKLRLESLEDRRLLAADWANPTTPFDVNDDGRVNVADVSNVGSYISEHGERHQSQIEGSPAPYYDANADGFVSQLDQVQIIDEIFQAETPKQVALRIQPWDASGTITSVEVGERFFIQVIAEDLRDEPAGVFAAYTDVLFDPTLAKSTGVITHSDLFTNGRSGELAAEGVLDEVGAFVSSGSPTGDATTSMFYVEMIAIAPGDLKIITDPAEESPEHDVLLFGRDGAVSTSAIDYGSFTLSVVEHFEAHDDHFLTQEGTARVLDVIANDEGRPMTLTSVGVGDQGGKTQIGIRTDNVVDGDRVLLSVGGGNVIQVVHEFEFDNDGRLSSPGAIPVNFGITTGQIPTAQSLVNAIEAHTSFSASIKSLNETAVVVESDATAETYPILFSELAAVVYTPANGFDGVEQFEYTALGGSVEHRANVTVNVQPVEDIMRVRLVVTDTTGQVITTATPGQEILLTAYVEDIRDDAEGVFAAYVDVKSSGSFDRTGNLVHGADFSNGRSSGSADGYLLDDAGGFGDVTADGAGEQMLFSLPITTTEVGTLTFTSEAADVSPEHDTLLFGLDDAVPGNAISFGTVEVEVVKGWQNPTLPADVNNDGHVSPIDALAIINDINTNGARELGAVDGNEMFLDVNGDGHCSPADVLAIINVLYNHGASAPEGEAISNDDTQTIEIRSTLTIDASTLLAPSGTAAQSDVVIDDVPLEVSHATSGGYATKHSTESNNTLTDRAIVSFTDDDSLDDVIDGLLGALL